MRFLPIFSDDKGEDWPGEKDAKHPGFSQQECNPLNSLRQPEWN